MPDIMPAHATALPGGIATGVDGAASNPLGLFNSVSGQLGLQLPAGIPTSGGTVSPGTGIGTGGTGSIGTGTGSCSVCRAATGLDAFLTENGKMFGDLKINLALNVELDGNSIYNSQKKYLINEQDCLLDQDGRNSCAQVVKKFYDSIRQNIRMVDILKKLPFHGRLPIPIAGGAHGEAAQKIKDRIIGPP